MAIVPVPLKSVIALHMDNSNEALPAGWALCDGSTITNPNSADPASWLQEIIPGALAAYTVPDLRNKFLLGADATKTPGTVPALPGSGNIDAAAGAPGPKATGGSNQHQLTLAELASHNHGGGVHSHTLSNLNHTHTLTDGGHTHSKTETPHSHTVNDPGHAHGFTDVYNHGLYLATTDLSTFVTQAGGSSTRFILQGATIRATDTTTTGITTNSGNSNVSINSATTGITMGAAGSGTVDSSSAIITSGGSDTPHNNRPAWYGVVYIIRVRY